MSDVDKLERHERLMSRMADLNGADLALAEQVGLITSEEKFDATLACTGCAAVPDCQERLDADTPGMPDYCRNTEMIRRLAGDMKEFGLAE